MPSPIYFFLGQQWGRFYVWQLLALIPVALVGQLLGRLTADLLVRAARAVVRRTETPWDDVFVEAVRAPLRALCVVIATYLPIRAVALPPSIGVDLSSAVHATVIGIVGWALIRAMHAAANAVGELGTSRETNDPERLKRARALRTQIILANRLGSVIIFVVVGAIVALQFNGLRAVGVSVLASAGVAGVVLGFAAQKSIGALFAGIQLSLSQPIRMGDSVTLEGEFGTIEDVGLTYVTVKLWDERRLIVPTTRLLDQPLRNWSRTAAGITGSVLLKVAFEIPVAAVREEFERIIALEPQWDGQIKTVQVTDAMEHAIELRFLMSARTPSALWDLRVSVREKLVLWLQGFEQGAHLPHTRVVMTEGETRRLSTLPRVTQRARV